MITMQIKTVKFVRIGDLLEDYGLTLEPLDYLPDPEIDQCRVNLALVRPEFLAEHIAARISERNENFLRGVPDRCQSTLHDLYAALRKIDDDVLIDLAS